MNLIIMPVVAGPEITKRCVESVLTQDIGDVTLLAIDNGSRDGCGAILRTFRDRTILQSYSSTRNLHFIWNTSLTWAFEKLNLPYALVINNDLVLRPDTFRLLVENNLPFATGVGVGDERQLKLVHPESRSPHPTFSCFLIRREVWERVGKFDERFWAWCGDGDYHLRMNKAGIEALSLDIPFYHQVSGTLKNVPRPEHNRLCLLADHDREMFANKYGFKMDSPEYYAAFQPVESKR